MTHDIKVPIAYFDQQVLASYRNEPDKWLVETDFFAGYLRTTDQYYKVMQENGSDSEYLDVRFGYRAIETGDLAIVAWLPDLVERSPGHLPRWRGFHLVNPVWAADDQRFQLWVRRYLEGDWSVENGPRSQLGEIVETIRGLTAIVLGIPLFSHPIPRTLPFPSAQNTHRYQDAHGELYKYLVDGIDKDCLKSLAALFHKDVNVDSNKTVESLKKLLPSLNETPSDFGNAFDLVSEQRRLASHKVRESACTFRAFEQFTEDLQLCVAGLKQLLGALETACHINGERATRRWHLMLQLPKIVRPPEAHSSICQASQMVGRTVAKVEFGFREDIEGVHGSELLIVHFTDGTILNINTGSNAGELADHHEGVKEDDFHVDFILHWVTAVSESGDGGSA